MKKISLFLMCLVVFSSMLAACGSKDDSKKDAAPSTDTPKADDTAKTADAPKVTIKIHYPTPDLVEKVKAEDDKIKRFQEAYPNVTIEKDDWQYNVNEIGVKMAANEAPTFFNTYATEAKFLVEKGWAADITDLYNNYSHKDELNPILQDQFVLDNKVYGLAFNGYVNATMINKKMLDDKGVAVPALDWTWDDMLNTAKAVADPKKGISGIAPMGKGNESGWNWTNFLFEAGGEIQNVDGGKVNATFNSEAGLKALEFYKQLRWDANAIPQDWALGWGDAVGSFAQGRTAMVMAGSDGVIDQALNQGGFKPEDILTYPMPVAAKGGKHTGVMGGDYWVVSPKATPEEQKAAFDYITFDYFADNYLTALEKDISDRKADGKFFVPALINYYTDDSEFGKKVEAVFAKFDNVYKYDPSVAALLDGKPEAQYNTQDYYATMTNVIQKVFTDKNTDLKKELDNAAKLVQEKFFDQIKVQ